MTRRTMVAAGEARAVGRVLPFQGGDGFIGPSSQGVALGCRVSAPLARNSHRTKVGLEQRLRRETTMKTPWCIILIIFIQVPMGISQDLVWGPPTNQAQISLTLEGNSRKIKANEPFNLVLHTKNVSSNVTVWLYSPTAPETTGFFVFRVVSPTGKDISSKPPKFFGGSGATIPVLPGQTVESKFDLRKICRMDQPGTYTVVAEREIWPLQGRPPFKATSNPLRITLVPGKWSPASTNRAKQW